MSAAGSLIGRMFIAIDEIIAAEGAPHCFERRRTRALVDRNPNPVAADLTKVDAIVHGVFHDQPLIGADLDRKGVEEFLRSNSKAERGQPIRESGRFSMHAFGDGLQALWAVEHRIHRGDDRRQNLRRADIGGGALATDMLFARLQREAIGAIAARVDGNAYQSARQRALIGVLDRDITGVRTSIAHGHSKTLHGAHGDIGAHFSRRFEQGERERIRRDHGDRLGVMQARDDAREIVADASDSRILEQRAKNLVGLEILERVADNNGPTERFGARARHRDRLWQTVFIYEERRRLRFRHMRGERHRLRRRRRLVEQRSIGDVEPGKIADGCLEIEHRLQSTLADFRLVGRVGRIPSRILQNIALDRRRHDRAVIALADERGQNPVLVRGLAQTIERAAFGKWPAEIERLDRANVLGNGLVDQRLESRGANNPQHLGDFLGRRPDVAPICEVIGIVFFGAHMVPRLANKGLVCVFVQQPLEIRHVRQLQLEEPASVEWILVDKGGIVHNCFIDLDHFAGQRREDVRGRLHRLDDRRAIALRQSRSDLWKLHEYQVAEGIRRMFGNAHRGDIPIKLQPFVIFRELQQDSPPRIGRFSRVCSGA